jgi:hypothetical protein
MRGTVLAGRYIVASARQWAVLISIRSDSAIEVRIAADSQWLVPSLSTYTPIAALDFVKSALVDARRGDAIFVELREPVELQSSYEAPTCDAVLSWLSSRLIDAWHRARASSGTYRPAQLLDSAEEAKLRESQSA